MRSIAILVLLTSLLPATARAAETCGPLKIVNIIHMIPSLTGDADFVPVVIDGKPRDFLLDTGGYYTQISRSLAEELKLSILQTRRELFDATGNITRDQAEVPEFTLGEMHVNGRHFMISPNAGTSATKGMDGVLAPDNLMPYDTELDFSTDTLNLFSPDHCPGHVVYWSAPAVAVVPIKLEGLHITVPVTLDGQTLPALIDTGATTTSLRMDEARELFNLIMGSADTPVNGDLNGDATLKTYSHQFKSLAFGDVTVSNPSIAIVPNAMGRNLDLTPLVGDRTKTERDRVNAPEVILGMDVLRRLRIYLAFKEGKMYVSPSSALPVGTTVQPYTGEFLTARLQQLDGAIAASPDDAVALNARCFWRAIAKTELDGALADCDKSLRLAPGVAATLDSRACVLFQQGKYQDALTAYNAALAADANLASSLWMRGLIEEKLGERAGKDADIAAARADDPNIEVEFKRLVIAE